jgi:hypothetical protein
MYFGVPLLTIREHLLVLVHLGTLQSTQPHHDVHTVGHGTVSVKSEDEGRTVLDRQKPRFPFDPTGPGSFVSKLKSTGIFSLPPHPLLGSFNGNPSILDPREVKRPSETLFSALNMTDHRELALKSQNSVDDAGRLSSRTCSDLLGNRFVYP